MSTPARATETSLPRILLELGEGRLDEDAAEALGDWIRAHGLIEPPETLTRRASQLFAGVAAGAA